MFCKKALGRWRHGSGTARRIIKVTDWLNVFIITSDKPQIKLHVQCVNDKVCTIKKKKATVSIHMLLSQYEFLYSSLVIKVISGPPNGSSRLGRSPVAAVALNSPFYRAICIRRTSHGPVSVCHTSVFYRNGWTNRAGFWHGTFLQPVLHCVKKQIRLYPKIRALLSGTLS